MINSQVYIAKIPESKHALFLSGSLLTTIVLAVQGIQATYLIVSYLLPNTDGDQKSSLIPGLLYIFVLIGCLGFLRLPAAFWLLNDFGYLPT
jgi:hypothetical protein